MDREYGAARQKPEPVFRVRQLSKVYRMGEVEVQAVRGVNLDLYAGGTPVQAGNRKGESPLPSIVHAEG
jgi:putative ABC transport system ATP-binding protein